MNFDNATKLLSFSEPNCYVGAVTYGSAVIGQRTAHSYIPEFEIYLQKGLQEEEKSKRLGVFEFSQKLSSFFMERWREVMPSDYSGADMTFIVGGYDPGDAYGKVFVFSLPGQPEPQPRNENDFAMTWGGQLQIASRLIHGYDPGLMEILRQTLKINEQQINQLTQVLKAQLEFLIPYQILPLQDCIDLATFLIRTTMTAQGLAVGVRGVGGPIDVATITRTEGLRYVQQKKIHGEGR